MQSTARGVRSYRDLQTWQKAFTLALECYKLTRRFPRSELYGLAAQVRRAAVSVPANIAEGNGRMSRGDYVRHLRIAHGSLMELETHLLLARDLSFLSTRDAERVLTTLSEVGRMLGGLARSLQAPTLPGAS